MGVAESMGESTASLATAVQQCLGRVSSALPDRSPGETSPAVDHCAARRAITQVAGARHTVVAVIDAEIRELDGLRDEPGNDGTAGASPKPDFQLLPLGAPDEATALREIRSYLMRHAASIHHELRDELTPLLYDSSDRLDRFVSARDGATINEYAHYLPLDGPMPYSLYSLPPTLLLPLCRDGVPVLPSSAAEVERLMDDIWPDHLHFHRSTAQVPYLYTDEEMRERWTAEFISLAGTTVDPEDWRRYLAVHHAQLDRGYYELDYVSSKRARPGNVAFSEAHGMFAAATGQHDHFVMAGTTADRSHERSQVAERLQVPIGEYGPEFAASLARTAGFMIDFDERDAALRADSLEIVGRNAQLIDDHTLRAMDSSTPQHLANSLVSTVQEGDMTIMAALSLLTSERVAGYEDDPAGLVRQIIDDDLVNQLTLRSPLTVAGTSFFHGVYFPGLVAPAADGGLALQPEPLERLRQMRARSIRLHEQLWREYEEDLGSWQDGDRSTPRPRPPVRTGLGCPVAGRQQYLASQGPAARPGGITRRTRTFGRILEMIRPMPNGRVRIQGHPHQGGPRYA